MSHEPDTDTPAIPGSSSSQGRLRDWLVIALLTAAMMFSLLDRIGIAVLMEPIKRDLGIGDSAFGLLNGLAFGLCYSFLGMPLGWLADRWSRKGTITLGIGIWSLSTALSGLATSFWQLMSARVFVGAGEAGLAPAAYGIIHDRLGKRNLATAISVLQVGSAIGAGSALLISGSLYGVLSTGAMSGVPIIGGLAAWQQTFIFLALPGVFFVCTVPFLRDAKLSRVKRPPGELAVTLLSALRRNVGIYTCLFVGMSAITVCSYAMLSWLPAVLGREFGWSPARAGTTYGTFALMFGPIGLLSGGWICDFLERRNSPIAHSVVPLVAGVGGLTASLFLPFVSTPIGLLLTAGFAHFFAALPVGVVPALLQLLTPAEARGRVSAFYVMLINFFGLGVASVLIGAISSHFAGDPHALRLVVGVTTITCFGLAVISFIVMQHIVKIAKAAR